MSNRTLKLILHKQDPRCYWCGVETILTNIQHIKGQPDPRMATIDHLVSKFSPLRWVKQQPGELRKVLACFKCNNERSQKEVSLLAREEVVLRGKGFALNKGPDGKPLIKKPLEKLDEVLDIFNKNGILPPDDEKRQSSSGTVAERRELSEVFAPGSH